MKQVNKAGKLNSYDEIEKGNGWLLKMSTMNNFYILFIIRSKHTGQVIIRYFDDEEIARLFVDFVCEQDALEEIDI